MLVRSLHEFIILGLIARERPDILGLDELYSKWVGDRVAQSNLYRYVENLKRAGLIYAHPTRRPAVRRGRVRSVYVISPLGEAELQRIEALIAPTTVNAAMRSDDWRGRILSNLSDYGFVLDDVSCASVEGLIQGIKFPPGDERREATFALHGLDAWRMRKQAEGNFVWWLGEAIPYHSAEHATLIRRAIEAKFAQNADAMEALRATRGLTIIHETGRPESPTTSLPAVVYCQILTEIRDAAP